MTVSLLRNDVALQLLEAAGGYFDLQPVQLGNRFGLYRALEDGGPSTALELAVATGLREAHLAPWLALQARTGFLDRSGSMAGIRYRLNREIRDALLDSRALEALSGDDYWAAACSLAPVSSFAA